MKILWEGVGSFSKKKKTNAANPMRCPKMDIVANSMGSRVYVQHQMVSAIKGQSGTTYFVLHG